MSKVRAIVRGRWVVITVDGTTIKAESTNAEGSSSGYFISFDSSADMEKYTVGIDDPRYDDLGYDSQEKAWDWFFSTSYEAPRNQEYGMLEELMDDGFLYEDIIGNF